MITAIYARVSTRDKGQDVENQLAQMRDWAAREGHTIIAVYTDDVSGSGLKRRPGFEAMLQDARAGKFQMLLFWSLDRLSREGVYATLTHLKHLDEAGICWRSHTEAYLDSCGVFREAVLAILAAIAKQERLRISERVKAGLEVARANGRIGGRRPIDRDPALIERMLELRDQSYSIKQIVFIIEQEFGAKMSMSNVHRILMDALRKTA